MRPRPTQGLRGAWLARKLAAGSCRSCHGKPNNDPVIYMTATRWWPLGISGFSWTAVPFQSKIVAHPVPVRKLWQRIFWVSMIWTNQSCKKRSAKRKIRTTTTYYHVACKQIPSFWLLKSAPKWSCNFYCSPPFLKINCTIVQSWTNIFPLDTPKTICCVCVIIWGDKTNIWLHIQTETTICPMRKMNLTPDIESIYSIWNVQRMKNESELSREKQK